MSSRLRAYAVSLILVVLVASPLVGAFEGDSFPISTYPMFASRKSNEVRLSHVVLVGADGAEWAPPPSAIANDEALQAQETLRQALDSGEAATADLCERIARRVVKSEAAYVHIVTSTYDAILYYQGQREPLARSTIATCDVQT
jgi:hypothetical protein